MKTVTVARQFMVATLATLTFAALSPASAEGFTVFIYETAQDYALRTDAGQQTQAYWAEYAAYGKALAQAGVVRGGAALVGDFKRLPAPNELVLGGYFVIEAANAAEAQSFASRAPANLRGGRVEVIEHYPAPIDASGAPPTTTHNE